MVGVVADRVLQTETTGNITYWALKAETDETKKLCFLYNHINII